MAEAAVVDTVGLVLAVMKVLETAALVQYISLTVPLSLAE